MSRFDEILAVTLGFEGGFSDDPDDRGGATNFGITSGTLKVAFNRGLVRHCDVRRLTPDEVRTIYRVMFWDPVGGDDLPQPLDFIMFDASVNHGVGGASKLLQEALNALLVGTPLAVDGAIGPKSRAALRDLLAADERLTKANPGLEPHFLLRYLCLDVLMNRTELFTGIAARDQSQQKYYRGWIHNRVVRLAEAAGMES